MVWAAVSLTVSQILNKILVFKISHCKMSFFLLADLHKSWKWTNCFTAHQLLTFILVVYIKVIKKEEKKLYIPGQNKGQINIICHMVPAQETEKKSCRKKGQIWFVVSETQVWNRFIGLVQHIDKLWQWQMYFLKEIQGFCCCMFSWSQEVLCLYPVIII